MRLRLSLERRNWPRREPFVISRETISVNRNLIVTVEDEAGVRGRGEGCPIAYYGETADSLALQIEAAREAIEAGAGRQELLRLMPAGAARAAVDAALWDLESRRHRTSVFKLAKVGTPRALVTAFTIGIRSLEAYRASAKAHADYPLLKVKVGAGEPFSVVNAVRAGAPDAALILDPNQAWSVTELKAYAPGLAILGVSLLEQPIRVGDEGGLDGYCCPVPLCADELIDDRADLEKAAGRFDVVNIKLDKAGGLTEALSLAEAAGAAGFRLMVGCMGGSSLAMAPALVLAQRCEFVDLDGPLHQAEDIDYGLTYRDGWVSPPDPSLWGGATLERASV